MPAQPPPTQPPDETVILLCPCCASTVDALAGPYLQHMYCGCCGQSWQMVVDATRQADHSLT